MATKDKIYLTIIAALVLAIWVIWRQPPEIITEFVEIPATSGGGEVVAPEAVKVRDTVWMDGSVEVIERENPINSELMSLYESAIAERDSLAQIMLYKDAITERRYTEVYEDSTAVVTVDSDVVGRLARQSVKWTIKPRIYEVNSVVPRSSIYVGGFVGLGENNPILGAKVDYITKNQKNIISLGYTTEKKAVLMYSKKIL